MVYAISTRTASVIVWGLTPTETCAVHCLSAGTEGEVPKTSLQTTLGCKDISYG